VYCVTVATTVKFNLGNDEWCYPVCNDCRKKTKEIGAFKCVMCGFNNEKLGIMFIFFSLLYMLTVCCMVSIIKVNFVVDISWNYRSVMEIVMRISLYGIKIALT